MCKTFHTNPTDFTNISDYIHLYSDLFELMHSFPHALSIDHIFSTYSVLDSSDIKYCLAVYYTLVSEENENGIVTG